MMTLYLIFEKIQKAELGKSSTITISARASRQPRSKLWLEPNTNITIDKAILALVIRSANDVAVAVAEHISGSEKKFSRLMTKKAIELGMVNTIFKNASGLSNRSQLSTAEDLAILVANLMEDFPTLYQYFSESEFTLNGQTYRGHNNFLKKYPGADGLKTGYTRASGYNLAASAVRKDIRLVGILLGGKTAKKRDKHLSALMNQSFATILLSKPPPLPHYKPQIINWIRR
jgi:D-alanyl-D-alanine carboxypeptidase